MMQIIILLNLFFSLSCSADEARYLSIGECTINPISKKYYTDIAKAFQNELKDTLKNKNIEQHVTYFFTELSHVSEHQNNKFTSLSFKDIAFLEYMYSYYHPRNDLNRATHSTSMSMSLDVISLAQDLRKEARNNLEIIIAHHTEHAFQSLSHYLLGVWENILI